MSQEFSLHNYTIQLGPLAETLPAWLQERQYSRIFVISDENTRAYCLPQLAALFFREGQDSLLGGTTLPAGEIFKTLSTCQQVWQAMLEAQLDRKALVINLGGGVVGDLGGFCAATWKRGVDFIQVPTTLLSMTDAAIGGKLGVDFQGIKNTIGVFQNPAAVFVDPAFLQTLPEQELRSGFAEVIKHALIGDPVLWQNLLTLSNLEDVPWTDVLRASMAVKVRIVSEDPLEKGLRMLLNYGHSIGHAVESYFLKTPFPWTHGEAIALGMITESWLARAVIPNGHNRLAQVISLIAESFPHAPIPEAAFAEIWATMQQDKKNAAGAVRVAVPGDEPYTLHLLETHAAAVMDSLRFYNGLAGAE